MLWFGMPLGVTRREILLVGEEPHLQQVRRLGLGGIEFTVRHSGAGTHELDLSGLEHATIAHAVLVFERAFDNVAEDLHVAMRMHGESATGRNVVVIDHPQCLEMHVLRIVIFCEAECEPAVEPAVIGMATLQRFSQSNHDGRDTILRTSRMFLIVINGIT